MKIAFLVANPFADEVWAETRPYKQSQALLQAGHHLVVLGTGRYGKNPVRQETRFGLTIIRRPTILHQLYTALKPHRPQKTPDSKKRKEYYAHPVRGLRGELLNRFLQLMHDINMVLFCAAILPQAARQRADVYVGTGLPGLLPAYLAARLTGARLVYDSLELWTEQSRQVPYGPMHKAAVSWLERQLCRCCDLVITMSGSVAKILSERYGIPEPLVIANVHPYVDVAPSAEIRQALTLGKFQKVVIYAGYLDYGKGLEQLIDAASYLDNGTGIALMGDGILRPLLEQRVRENHLEGRVNFTGWVPSAELPQYIASADLGVSPMQRTPLNYYHNIDNKLFHYVIGGIPSAVSDHPEKRRIVEKYGIGATFDERDPRDIARVINELLSDADELEAMRQRCRKAARKELSWEVVSRQFVAAIERLQE